MKYPILIVLAIVAVAVAAYLGWRFAGSSKHSGRLGWVANTGYLSDLPQFKMLQRRSRWIIAAVCACFGLAVGAAAVTAGTPVDRRIDSQKLASRDIIICLDASGSMIPYDGQIADAFTQIVDHFSGERISLQLWNSRSVTKFPLTDDYRLANRMLAETSSIMKKGFLGQEDDGILVTQELIDYLFGTTDDNDDASSLAGDGLAACVLGFDHTDSERSRLILYATDNEVMGSQIYTLPQAMKFAADHDVVVTAVYPGMKGLLTAEGEELKSLVATTGGDFYDVSNPASVDNIIEEIESLQRVDLEADSKVLETDKPTAALAWAIAGTLSLLAFLAVGRL